MKMDKRQREQEKVYDDKRDDHDNRSVSSGKQEEGSDFVKRARNAKKPRVTVVPENNNNNSSNNNNTSTTTRLSNPRRRSHAYALPTRANKKSGATGTSTRNTPAAATAIASRRTNDRDTRNGNQESPQMKARHNTTLKENDSSVLENQEKLAATMLCNMAPASAPTSAPTGGHDSSSTRDDHKDAVVPSAQDKDTPEETNAAMLWSREELAVSMLCSMAPKKDAESTQPQPSAAAATNATAVTTAALPPRADSPAQQDLVGNREQLAASMLCRMLPSDEENEETPSIQPKPPAPIQQPDSFRTRLQTPEKLAVSMLCNMDGKQESNDARESTLPSTSKQATETVYVDAPLSDEDNNVEQQEGSGKKKRRKRDLSKPTLDSLVQDKFGGDVFHFLECVEKEMNVHNFSATGLARKYGAVNCQSRFRTIVAELKEEPIVGMSRLWKERVQAYLRSKRGGDGHGTNSVVDERLRSVKRYVKRNAESETQVPQSQIKSEEEVAATTLRPLVQGKVKSEVKPQPPQREPQPPAQPRKRHRPTVEESARTTLDLLVQEKFGGDTFHFLQLVEKEMNTEGFTATGLARKYGAVNCQSRFRTIVAELKGEPIVGMSRLWKERVQAYLRSKESKEEADEDMATDESTAQEDTPRLVQDNAKWKRGSPGTVGMFVRQTYGSDFNGFLQNLEEEMKLPGFTAAGYARRHNITEGRKMLVNIVAELKGLPNTKMTQTWKDRVQAYLLSRTKGEDVGKIPSSTTEVADEEMDEPDLENDADDSGVEAGQSAGSSKPMTLRFTEEGHPLGVLDTLVQEKFEGDVFAFLDYLEQEVQVPDFTAGTFARKHGVTEGKRTLQRIVAQLKGESAHSSQMWKDRVQAYMQYKAGTTGTIYQVASVPALKDSPMDMMDSTMDDASNEDVIKENVTTHEEATLQSSNQAAV